MSCVVSENRRYALRSQAETDKIQIWAMVSSLFIKSGARMTSIVTTGHPPQGSGERLYHGVNVRMVHGVVDSSGDMKHRIRLGDGRKSAW